MDIFFCIPSINNLIYIRKLAIESSTHKLHTTSHQSVASFRLTYPIFRFSTTAKNNPFLIEGDSHPINFWRPLPPSTVEKWPSNPLGTHKGVNHRPFFQPFHPLIWGILVISSLIIAGARRWMLELHQSWQFVVGPRTGMQIICVLCACDVIVHFNMGDIVWLIVIIVPYCFVCDGW